MWLFMASGRRVQRKYGVTLQAGCRVDIAVNVLSYLVFFSIPTLCYTVKTILDQRGVKEGWSISPRLASNRIQMRRLIIGWTLQSIAQTTLIITVTINIFFLRNYDYLVWRKHILALYSPKCFPFIINIYVCNE